MIPQCPAFAVSLSERLILERECHELERAFKQKVDLCLSVSGAFGSLGGFRLSGGVHCCVSLFVAPWCFVSKALAFSLWWRFFF